MGGQLSLKGNFYVVILENIATVQH